jgi:hypothetical protein
LMSTGASVWLTAQAGSLKKNQRRRERFGVLYGAGGHLQPEA